MSTRYVWEKWNRQKTWDEISDGTESSWDITSTYDSAVFASNYSKDTSTGTYSPKGIIEYASIYGPWTG